MRRILLVLVLAAAVLAAPEAATAASTAPKGTYPGKAQATVGSAKYGKATFTISKGKLVSWAVEQVPRQCRTPEQMNYGFTVASNVLAAYGLTKSDITLSKKGRLRFTYRQPSHLDTITVNVKFSQKKAHGTVVEKAASAPLTTLNCSGSARFALAK